MNIDVKTVQRAVVGHGIAHDSAAKQIAGEASYIDDMAELPGTLHAALVISPVAHGKLKGIDPVKALAMPGVVAFVAAADIPGHNEVGPSRSLPRTSSNMSASRSAPSLRRHTSRPSRRLVR